MSHLEQAVYSTIHDSDIPAKAIAPRLGMSHQVLLNKGNAQCCTHKLGLQEAVALMLTTGNYSIYHAIGTEIDIQESEEASKPVMSAMLDSCSEHGDVVGKVHKALEDDELTNKEVEAILREISEVEQSYKDLRKALVSRTKTDSKLRTAGA